jgi:hypothetical protein
MFKPGEKVRFLNDVGGGIVVRMIDPETVLVRTEDDWEIPVAKSNVIRKVKGNYLLSDSGDDEYTSRIKKPTETKLPAPLPVASAPKRKIPEEPEPSLIFKPPTDVNLSVENPGIFVAMVPLKPADPENSDLKIYLVNDSNYFMLFNFGLDFGGNFSSRFAGQLEPDTKFHIETFSRQDLPGLNSFLIQAIFFRTCNYQPLPPIEKKVKINHTALYRKSSFVENDFFDERVAIFCLSKHEEKSLKTDNQEKQNDLAAELREKMLEPKKQNAVIQKDLPKNGPVEVDLHIHELTDEPERLEPMAILEIQMKKVKQTLDNAIVQKQPKVVFIHGVGQGKLKYEIRKELDSNYKGIEYQDASFQEYGYGATMVLIPQNYLRK